MFFPSNRPENRRQRARETIPGFALLRELLPAGSRHRIDLRPSPIFGYLPLGANEPSLLEPVEGRVERSGVHVQYVVRDCLNAEAEVVAVGRLRPKKLQYDEIERALKKWSARQFGHGSRLDGLVVTEVSPLILRRSRTFRARDVPWLNFQAIGETDFARLGDGEARGLAAWSG